MKQMWRQRQSESQFKKHVPWIPFSCLFVLTGNLLYGLVNHLKRSSLKDVNEKYDDALLPLVHNYMFFSYIKQCVECHAYT